MQTRLTPLGELVRNVIIGAVIVSVGGLGIYLWRRGPDKANAYVAPAPAVAYPSQPKATATVARIEIPLASPTPHFVPPAIPETPRPPDAPVVKPERAVPDTKLPFFREYGSITYVQSPPAETHVGVTRPRVVSSGTVSAGTTSARSVGSGVSRGGEVGARTSPGRSTASERRRRGPREDEPRP